jgi:hypothetical protein
MRQIFIYISPVLGQFRESSPDDLILFFCFLREKNFTGNRESDSDQDSKQKSRKKRLKPNFWLPTDKKLWVQSGQICTHQ